MKNCIIKFFYEDLFNKNCEKLLRLRKKIKINNNYNIFNIIRKIRYKKLCYKYGTFFPLSTEFGDNNVFPHGINGIYISGKAKIGNNCTIFQQVTIGSNTLKDSKTFGAPVIGDNVYIGAGAKIIGNVKVGNNVRIGANAVIVKDVPDNCTIVVDNMRIIEHNKPRENRFVSINNAEIN